MRNPNQACRAFRAELERALEGRARPDELTTLSWNEHLLACGACRALLEREEALEELLAGWPEPQLSPERRRALLACLRASARDESSLDELLEADDRVDAPAGLAQRVLAGVDDAGLDALLDMDRELAIPSGLAAHVLDGVAAERTPATRFRLDRRWLWPAAAAAAAVALLLSIPRDEPVAPGVPDVVEGPDAPRDPIPSATEFDGVDVAVNDTEPDGEDEMLAVLDILEQDALWDDESLDLELTTEIEIDEEWLLEYTLERTDEENDGDGAEETR